MKRVCALFGLIALLGFTLPVPAAEALSTGSAARASAGAIVLGSKSYRPDGGTGWGTVKPGEIFNGGDPGGLVYKIRWQKWGQKTAIGWGLAFPPRPTGNYYGAARTELRATDIGRCSVHGPLAYRHLSVREPARPGAPLGPWFYWSGSGNICRAP